jgi:hypothetical protein
MLRKSPNLKDYLKHDQDMLREDMKALGCVGDVWVCVLEMFGWCLGDVWDVFWRCLGDVAGSCLDLFMFPEM